MGQEPAELRRDIERRRNELADTIDAIGDRVSPGRVIERRRNRMTEGLRSFKDRVMGTVSSAGDAAKSVRDDVGPDAVKGQTAGSPIGAGLVAFGIGFLVAAAMPATQPEVDAAHKAEDALQPAKDALVETAQHVGSNLKDQAVDAAQQVKETAASAADEIATTTKQEAAATKDDAQRATS